MAQNERMIGALIGRFHDAQCDGEQGQKKAIGIAEELVTKLSEVHTQQVTARMSIGIKDSYGENLTDDDISNIRRDIVSVLHEYHCDVSIEITTTRAY